ncbi:hypothetical protein C8Q80DRAFT_1186474 [Daedaleopsis nitida]|nr:hypothetical protein C8Q80DRAFT_1186474 [Daedaleopsis nitida]
MRFSALSALVVLGASIAAASPIRVIVSELSLTGPIRNGHHAVGNDDHVPAAVPSHMAMVWGGPKAGMMLNGTHQPHRTGCGGMRGKALDASNALRKWLGLEPIKLEPSKLHVEAAPNMHHAHHMEGQGGAVIVKTMPMHGANGSPVLPYIGTPVRPAFDVEDAQERGHHHAIHHGHWRGHYGPSFMRRLHLALMSLGPWEGRAVAFVLGCGIGVLLRMVWVIALVTVRAFRTRREDETEYEIVFDETEAEMLVAPPQYTVIEGADVVPVTKDEKSEKN